MNKAEQYLEQTSLRGDFLDVYKVGFNENGSLARFEVEVNGKIQLSEEKGKIFGYLLINEIIGTGNNFFPKDRNRLEETSQRPVRIEIGSVEDYVEDKGITLLSKARVGEEKDCWDLHCSLD